MDNLKEQINNIFDSLDNIQKYVEENNWNEHNIDILLNAVTDAQMYIENVFKNIMEA